MRLYDQLGLNLKSVRVPLPWLETKLFTQFLKHLVLYKGCLRQSVRVTEQSVRRRKLVISAETWFLMKRAWKLWLVSPWWVSRLLDLIDCGKLSRTLTPNPNYHTMHSHLRILLFPGQSPFSFTKLHTANLFSMAQNYSKGKKVWIYHKSWLYLMWLELWLWLMH